MDSRTKTTTKPARDRRAKAPGKEAATDDLGARETAEEFTRRDLAAWLMSVRAQLEAVCKSMGAVHDAVADPEHLLHGALDAKRLGEAVFDLESLTGELCLLLVDCKPGDPVKYAEGYMKHWNV
ncbi:hypothetical protein [Frigoriglobus tundricola]|uniref:Uncharacterized protein n=1 Tax=Frigoriglobus tundricola TaxID=2774151 RepID=A0A6M5YIP4_9BACT|nr:hypothetical protein [Frigoriglobus tundricola]QJW93113.1 hypothetical protein FTUN_0616 [Frigoriglobus tundricola]QJX01232.1 hypothetical protein FTUN_8871 [Frigoriglobus tundricola]